MNHISDEALKKAGEIIKHSEDKKENEKMEKQQNVRYFNITQEEVSIINATLDVMRKTVETNETNIKVFNNQLERLQEDKWLLDLLKNKKFGKSSKQERFDKLYKNICDVTDQAIIDYNYDIKRYKEEIEFTKDLLEACEKEVETKTMENGEIHYIYNKEFFKAIIIMVKAINHGQFF